MRFRNHAATEARMLTSAFDDDRNLAAVIARPSFVLEGEELREREGTPWPVQAAERDTPAGTFPGDLPFLTGGVDVMVFGSARAPERAPVESLTVTVRVGRTFRRSVRVTGDRVWARAGDTLEPTAPRPFRSMPLTYDRAFGGRSMLEHDVALPWPANPGGCGFYGSLEEAEGRPLPNLEEPDQRIEGPLDRVDTAGVAPCPAGSSLGPVDGVELHGDGGAHDGMRRMTPRLFNVAHPKMVIPAQRAPEPGALVEVTNVRPGGGDARFALPAESYHLHVQLEERGYLYPLHLDLIGVAPDEALVFLSYRVVFRYRLRPLERRTATLRRGPCPAAVPDDYVIAFDDEPAFEHD